jgi:thioredoxin reductase (NADPH)
MDLEQLIIIGSGPAALSAAIYAARSSLRPLIIEGKTPGGQLMNTTYVENWPGHKSILGPTLMLQMREHAEHFGTRFVSDEVITIGVDQKPFLVETHKSKLHATALIIATGATPKRLGCPGEDYYWGKGVTTCAVCDGAFYRDKEVLIVGGGDTAMEDASFMTNFTNKITIVHILDKLTASHAMQQRVLNNPAITIIYNATVTAFEGDGTRVSQATITDQKSGKSYSMPIDVAFIAVGLYPNTRVLQGKVELDKFGYVSQKIYTQTSVPGIFAAGDVVDFRYRQAITSAGTGCMAALDAERYIRGYFEKS